jgi:hypothetical protein
MGRRNGGTSLALRSGLCLFAALLAAACSPSVSPSPTPDPTPLATPRLPTPVPTALATPGPEESAAPTPIGLLIRLTSCSHTCGPEPGTTILDDGRVIWQDANLRPLEARLMPAVLQRVRDELDASGVLHADADMQAELRPGAEPVGRGATLYRFERLIGERRVVVTSGDPADYADEPDLWVIPPQMAVLADLAAKLRDPIAWLGPDALVEPARGYEPAHYLVLVDLFPEVGAQPGLDADADDVRWPFGRPIEGVGEPADATGAGLGTRCLVIDAAMASATAGAEQAAGANRSFGSWISSVEYGWRRADGFVIVSLTPLLPHETGSCVDLVPTFP